MSSFFTTKAEPSTSSGIRGSSIGPARWFGIPSSRSKKNIDVAVRIRPLSGISGSSEKSNAEMRSEATMSKVSASTW